MATNNKVRKAPLAHRGSLADGELHNNHPFHHGNNDFAPQHQQQLGPPMHPLAPSPKRVKRKHPNDSPGKSRSTKKYPSPVKMRPTHPTTNVAPPTPQVLPAPVTSVRSNAAAASQQPTITPQQNPYSTSRGLRHFSMKVCEKVEEKGTTTYNEVADEVSGCARCIHAVLVRELKQAELAINAAAAARGEVPAAKKTKAGTSKNKTGKAKKNHDDKNIRRRVYDALNVLMAMDIITKEKKEITWRGLPGSRVEDDLGDGSGPNNGLGGCNKARSRVDGLSRRQRVQQLQEDVGRRQEHIKRKRECLQQLMVQNVCFQNLLGRNHSREMEERRRPTKRSSEQVEQVQEDDKCEVREIKDEKIPLPFLIVNTDSRAVVQCEMCPERTNVSFDFSLPFEINDDNEILKRLGM
ncbi:hypothetical protein ACHAXR_008775 [Thalassiosira sp. AJA248-18]